MPNLRRDAGGSDFGTSKDSEDAPVARQMAFTDAPRTYSVRANSATTILRWE